MLYFYLLIFFFFFKQKTAYEMRISDWSSDVCSSDLGKMTLPITSWHADEGLPNARPLARCAAMPLRFDRDQLPIWRDARHRNSLLLAGDVHQIGRASCRDRVCQYV